MDSYPYVEIWERVSVRHESWERSFDKGKTWEPVDWSMYPFFPFSSINLDAAFIGARTLTVDEFKKLYPDKEPG